MSDFIARVTDPYERQARLYPALLAIAPLAVMLACLYGPRLTAGSGVVSILVGSGALYLLSSVARSAGRRLEATLFQEWGGKPTTQILRHSDRTLDSVTKGRYHAALSKGINRPFPNPDDEACDPAAADEVYQSGVRWLIEQTRDTTKFSLLLKENIAYGFNRNMLGLRSVGIASAAIAIFGVLWKYRVVSIQEPFINLDHISALSTVSTSSLAISTAMLVLWFAVFSKERVRQFAFVYAERLLQACEVLV